MRRSELVAVQVEHLTHLPNGVEIFLPSSKTDQKAEGRTVFVPYANGERCPVRALIHWLEVSEINEGFVFRAVSRHDRVARLGLSAQSVARMRAELPQLLPDEQMVTEHLVSTEAGLRQLAQVIEAGADPRRVELPPSTIAIARAVVQQQVSLADLMRNYRLAQELVWQWMHARIAAAEPDPADLAKAIERLGNFLASYRQ